MSLNEIVGALGPMVLLPFMIFVFALCFRVKVDIALNSALLVGTGFIGVNILVDFFSSSVSESIKLMSAATGKDFSYFDVGWPILATIALSGKIGVLIFPVGLAVNAFLLLIKATDTFNIDLWNYWHFAFIGAVVYATTGSLTKCVFAAILTECFILFLADWSQPVLQEYYGYQNISITTCTVIEFFLIGIIGNKLCDLIGLGQFEITPATIQKKLKAFGSPVVMGSMIGFLIGLFAHIKNLNSVSNWVSILQLAIAVGAVMHMFPIMSDILIKGLMPLSNDIRETFRKWGIKRDIHFGMDAAVCIGDAANVASGLLMTPICVIMMVILPYNKFLWIISLGAFQFICSVISPLTKGNVIKNVIICTLYTFIGDWFVTSLSGIVTSAAVGAEAWTISNGLQGINAANCFSWLVYSLSKGCTSWIGLSIVFAIYVIGIVLFRRYPNTFYMISGCQHVQVKQPV